MKQLSYRSLEKRLMLAPVVEDVLISSTRFADDFIQQIDPEHGVGYSLVGDRQLETVPWQNIDTLYLQFSEDVSGSLSTDDIRLAGSLGGTFGVQLVAYEAASDRAEFRINNAVDVDSFVVSLLDGSVANAAGDLLDGEWISNQTRASGDGTSGGQFDFFFNVLVGDEDGSGQINSADAFEIYASNTHAANSTNIRGDIDGNGQITQVDTFASLANVGYGIPTSPLAPSANYGSDFGSATAINTPIRLTGTFESSGDEHWFSFNTVAGQEYVFETPLDQFVELHVLDSDGTTLASSEYGSVVSWFAPDSDTYYLSLNSRYGNTPATYQLFGYATLAESVIQLDANNYYTNGIVSFKISDSTGFAPNATVRIESSSGDVETLKIDSDEVVFSSSISLSEGAASSGDGILQVAARDTLTAIYFDSDSGLGSTTTASDSAAIVADDHGNNAATATLLELPSEISGATELPEDEDWFRFSAVAGVTYRFELPSNNDQSLVLYDVDGATLLEQSPSGSPLISWDAPIDGTYYLAIAHSGFRSGLYQLSSSAYIDSHGGDAATATVLSLPANVTSAIDFGADQDWFRFSATADAIIQITMPNDGLSHALTVFDTDGVTQLATGTSDSSTITLQFADAGSYYLSVDNTDAHPYAFSVTELQDNHGDDATVATPLEFPLNISSSIDVADDEDWFRFTAVAGITHRLELTSDSNHELVLYDSDGTTSLAESLAGSSIITWDAPSDGAFYFAVRSLDGSEAGEYQISGSSHGDLHGNDAALATELEAPTIVASRIDFAGDHDWFRFDAIAGTKYEFEVPVFEEYTELILYDSDGTTQLERDYISDPSIVWSAPSDGTYFLSVANFTSYDIGDYELRISIPVDDHGDYAATATPLALPANTLGSIEIPLDIDYFSFEADGGTDYRIEIPVYDEFTVLILFDTDGTTQLRVDFFSDPSFIWNAPRDGTYYLSVADASDGITSLGSTGVGTYELSVEPFADNHGDTFREATDLILPTVVSDAIDFERDLDWFRFDAVGEETYRFESSDLGISTILTLYSGNGSTRLWDSAGSAPRIWSAPSDGVYYLSISSRSDTAAYELSVTQVFDDHGDSFAAATPLSDSGASGSISTDDEDWFSFEAVAGTTYLIAGSNTFEFIRLELFDQDGTTRQEVDIGSDSAPLLYWNAPSDGTYFLAVSAFSYRLGDYELSITSLVDGHGDSFATATPLNLSQNVLSAIDTPTDQDWFSFNSIAGERYRFEIPNSHDEASLFLYDTGGTTDLAQQRVGNAPIVWDAPSTGTYYLLVKDILDRHIGSYELSVTRISNEIGDDAASATPLSFPANISSSIDIPGDVDWFSFSAVAGTKFEFEIPAPDEYTTLTLFDSDGITELEQDQEPDALFIWWVAPSDGQYFLSVGFSSYSDTGDYELLATVLNDDHGEDATTATPLDLPSTVSSSIQNGIDEDWFSFVATAGTNFEFEITDFGNFLDVYIYDTDAATQLAQNTPIDDTISWNAPSNGTYYLLVTSFRDGNYELSISGILDDHGDNVDTASLLETPAAIFGSIELRGDQDWLQFDAAAGENFEFAVPVHEGVAELTLYDTDGVTELERDDSDTPSISWRAPTAGTYFLLMENTPGSSGGYKLTAASIVNEDDHGDDAANATSIGLATLVSGVIETPDDQDWFRISAIEDRIYRFAVSTPNQSVELNLYNTDGVTLLESNVDLEDWYAPTSEDYYLSVSGLAGVVSEYEIGIEIEIDDVGNNAGSAMAIEVPINFVETLEIVGDEDWYSFSVVAGQELSFQATSDSALIPQMALYDTDGTTRLELLSLGVSGWVAPRDGTYFLSVDGYLGYRAGDYNVSVDIIIDDHGDSAASASMLELPSSIQSSIELPGDVDWFSFNAVAGEEFLFDTPLQDWYTLLRLHDTDGTTVLLQNGGSSNPFYYWTAETNGTYYLSVQHLFHTTVGTYHLTAQTVVDEQADNASTTSLLQAGSIVSASIGFPGDRDWFRFDAIADLAYDFSLEWEFPGSIKASLYDADGLTVLADGNNTGNLSWIASETGTFYVAVEAISDDDFGDYSLSADSSIQETSIRFSEYAYLSPDSIKIDVIDGGGFAPGATLMIESSSGDSETVVITEAGTYASATLDSVESPAILNDGILQFAHGDRLVATYFDQNQVLGGRYFSSRSYVYVDDHGNDASTATIADSPSTTSGSIVTNNDQDWFAFTAIAGLDYVFEISLVDHGDFFDSSLTLYDIDGVTHLASDRKGGAAYLGDPVEGAIISWQAPATGTYYIAVESWDYAIYQLAVSSSAAPVIKDVIISSTQFSDDFIDVIGDGNGLGYSLLGGHQLESLPWMKIDTFYLQFSEDVSASLSADDVVLTGTNGGTHDVDLVGYDTLSNTAEFRINADISADSLLISIDSGSVVNPLDAMLDGEWTTGQSTPSGDGTPGGRFDFHFNVLVGDENASGQVNTSDALNIFGANTEAVDETNFRQDIDGNGQINSGDVFAAFANNTHGLPIAPAARISLKRSLATEVDSARDIFFSKERPFAKVETI